MSRSIDEFVRSAIELLGYDSSSHDFTNELQVKLSSGAIYSVLLGTVEPKLLPGVHVGDVWINLNVSSSEYLHVLRLMSLSPGNGYAFTWERLHSVEDMLSPYSSVQVIPGSSLKGDDGEKGEPGDKGLPGDKGGTGDSGNPGSYHVPYGIIEDRVVASILTTVSIVGPDIIDLPINGTYPVTIPYSIEVVTGSNAPSKSSAVLHVNPSDNGDISIDTDNNLTINKKPLGAAQVIVLSCSVKSPFYNKVYSTTKEVEISLS
jgi:hypothetical protein